MARDDSSRPSLACEDEARHQEILAAIQDIAAAIRERRDADDNVVDDGERCKRCGLPEWDCDCDIDPVVIGTPWWKQMLPGEQHLHVNDMRGKAVDINLPPVTPGAPPPERPDGVQFDPIPQPTFQKGDTIRVVTADGTREFTYGEAEQTPEPNPYWDWVASFDAGKPHPYLIGTGDEGFCNVCGLRTSMLHTVYNAMESLKKISPQRLTRRTE
jgi:hypothetical protein